MSYKLRPRVGSAIASTILSVFWAVSLVGVDKAQAAVLTYNFEIGTGGGSGFFKLNNSSVDPEINYQEIAVSEGRLNTPFILDPLFEGRKEYYNLAGAIALFSEGVFRGILGGGEDSATIDFIIPPEVGSPQVIQASGRAFVSMQMYVQFYRGSAFFGPSWATASKEIYIRRANNTSEQHKYDLATADVSYTLVDTEPEPVPEPITAGGTALALAGLSWLKQKKKLAA